MPRAGCRGQKMMGACPRPFMHCGCMRATRGAGQAGIKWKEEVQFLGSNVAELGGDGGWRFYKSVGGLVGQARQDLWKA